MEKMSNVFDLQSKYACAELMGQEKLAAMYKHILMMVMRDAGCTNSGADIRFLQMIGNPRPLPGSPDYDPEEHYKTAEEESDERALHEDDLYKGRIEEEGMESNGVL